MGAAGAAAAYYVYKGWYATPDEEGEPSGSGGPAAGGAPLVDPRGAATARMVSSLL